jgi:hypothetical protein
MKGNISVSSELGKGSCFTVQIPFAKANKRHEETVDIKPKEEYIERLKKCTILIAEDNEFNQLVAIDTLKSILPGISIDIANNGVEAVEKVKTNHYDLVLMDIRMPLMDGLEATKNIRNLSGEKHKTKIIAMTANVMEEDVRKYFEIGMNAYISKPFEQNELIEKMAEMLGLNNPAVPEITIAETNKKETRSIPEYVIDMNFLQKFTKGDSSKQHKYISMFLENAPKLLTQLKDGLKDKNYEQIKIAAHSLKPQLSYMGVIEDVSHIFMLEQSAGESAHQHLIPDLVDNAEKVCLKAFEELKTYINS